MKDLIVFSFQELWFTVNAAYVTPKYGLIKPILDKVVRRVVPTGLVDREFLKFSVDEGEHPT